MNILLVEDDDVDARAVERHLRLVLEDDLTLRRVGSLGAALAQIAVLAPDLAIVDLGLPDSRGLNTVKPLIDGMPERPVIVLTGDNDEKTALAALASGAADYLVKGVFTADGLRRAIRYGVERKRAEARIRQQADLLNRTHEGIVVCSLAGDITYWNSGCRLLFGKTGVDHPKDNFFNLLEMEPDQLSAALSHLKLAGSWGGEVNLRDGRTLLTRWTISTGAASGEGGEIVAMTSDVSEQKAVENQLRRSQRMEGVGALACGIAHDFNNLLTPIVMISELLRSGDADDVTPEEIDAMAASASRGAELVRQLLTFGRGADGQHLTLSLRPLLEELMRLAHSTFPKGVKLKLEVEQDLASVTGVATQLHQVLLNLVVNARDAMPQGGTITVRARNRRIGEDEVLKHAGMRPGQFVELEVSDTGTGIPEADRDRIFEPFFTTKPQEHGTGLGLSTTLGILKSHNATIHLQSEEGVGTTFRVLLPMNEEETVEITDTPELKSDHQWPQLGGQRILVVDDNEHVRSVVQRSLTKAGAAVSTAVNGHDALAVLASADNEFDLILTDIDMPVMGGEELTIALRNAGYQIPIACMSGFLRPEKEQQLREVLDGGMILNKPLSATEVVTAVSEALAENHDASRSPAASEFKGSDWKSAGRSTSRRAAISPTSLVVRLN